METKYIPYGGHPFEVRIRSLIQDAWSVPDHKIIDKKSIPVDLKRRINVLSALFDPADREFKEIRIATTELVQQAIVKIARDYRDNFIGGKPRQSLQPLYLHQALSLSLRSGRLRADIIQS